MSPTEDLVELVTEATGFSADEVQNTLTEQKIPRRRVLPTRQRLRVRAVHFAGIKNLRVEGSEHDRTLVPFSFAQELGQDVFAFATANRNDAGKSTVLETILWAVRGTTKTAQDVREWMRQAIVELAIGDDNFLVAWKLESGAPTGLIVQRASGSLRLDWASFDDTAMGDMTREFEDGQRPHQSAWDTLLEAERTTGAVVGTFDGDAGFKETIGDFMNSRFGFEEAEVFTKNRKAADALDGHISTHGWPLWSQALRIPEGGSTATIGEATQNTALLLEMYLGTSWGPTAHSAKARRGIIESSIATLRRRQTTEETARDASLHELEAQLSRFRTERAALPESIDADTYDDDLRDVQATADAVALAATAYSEAFTEQLAAHRAVAEAQADVVAAEEAAMTKRFWHSLKPTCCPRCDEPVQAEQWARESEGHCSLCNSALGLEEPTALPTTTPIVVDDASEDSDDDHDELELNRQRLLTLVAEAAFADAQLSVANEGRLNAFRLHTDAADRTRNRGTGIANVRVLDQQISVLEGRIQERASIGVPSADLENQERIVNILSAAEKAARKRSDAERLELLVSVSLDITALGRRLGFHQLDNADFKANTWLLVTKGGATPVHFGKCTPGEQLRLKIAIVIALLRNGTAAGIGRHPGLLVIDQITAEELNPVDVHELLTELVAVAAETGLQVIVGSARGELIEDVLDSDRVRMARPEDDLMW
ncbi:hypothetical protein [Salinibacterium sp. ZJ454]|uniref:hypothetical protein n=1 Tax=Salinibacterium sp. ZJ454 TaxID=2708339 RepID=UPI0014240630|nr:hypothetical protein [Salinibacterium sp. ZJ454]